MKKFSKITMLLVVLMVISFVTVSFAADAAKPAAAEGAKKEEAKKKEPPKPKILKVGDAVPEFSLPDGLSPDKKISYGSSIKGSANVVALVFMTTSCSACKAELSLMNDLVNKFGDDFKAFAVAVDLNGGKTVPDYDANYGFNVTYLLDPDFAIPHKFGFTFTPSMILIDKGGKIIYAKGGYSPASNDDIISAVKGAL